MLVVEAKAKSGSLITASYALEQGKTVYALPGRVGDALSEGCNRLIADGAGIAYSVETVLEELQISLGNRMTYKRKRRLVLQARKKWCIVVSVYIQKT